MQEKIFVKTPNSWVTANSCPIAEIALWHVTVLALPTHLVSVHPFIISLTMPKLKPSHKVGCKKALLTYEPSIPFPHAYMWAYECRADGHLVLSTTRLLL